MSVFLYLHEKFDDAARRDASITYYNAVPRTWVCVERVVIYGGVTVRYDHGWHDIWTWKSR